MLCAMFQDVVYLQRVHVQPAAGVGPEPRDGSQHRRAHAHVVAGPHRT